MQMARQIFLRIIDPEIIDPEIRRKVPIHLKAALDSHLDLPEDEVSRDKSE